jgi:hypothetical protein
MDALRLRAGHHQRRTDRGLDHDRLRQDTDGFPASDEAAGQPGGVVALRDAGAHFVTSFRKVPEVAQWLEASSWTALSPARRPRPCERQRIHSDAHGGCDRGAGGAAAAGCSAVASPPPSTKWCSTNRSRDRRCDGGDPGSPPRSDYETEFDFIECIADHITARDPSIEIIDEIEFINSMYPGSSRARRRCDRRTSTASCSRTGGGAARGPEARVHDLGGRHHRADQFRRLHDLRRWPRRRRLLRLRHLGQCLGLRGTIWDFTDRAEVGRLNASTSGQSYMPAVVVPIPIIAPVQGTACDGMGEQLLQFLSSEH